MISQLPKVFLSHATEDKVPFVSELASALSSRFNVWYDEYSLRPGDSIFQSVNAGLANCDFGVIVLSKPFFEKKWTKAELGGLFAREGATLRRIIPVWKDVTIVEVTAFSPILADRRAASASDGVAAVVESICRAIETAERPDGFVHTGTVANRFSELGSSIESFQASHRLSGSPEGARRVIDAQNLLLDLLERQAGHLAAESPQLGLRCKRGKGHCFPNEKIGLGVEGPGDLLLDIEFTRPDNDSARGARCDVGIFKRNRNGHSTKLEDRQFTPVMVGQEGVSWQDSNGTGYGHQQLCDLAFQRFYEHIKTWYQGATRT